MYHQPPSGRESAPYIYSHPKVEKLQDIVVGHFQSFQEKNVVTRAMIFCEVGSQFLQCIAVCCMVCVLHTLHIVKLWAYLQHCVEWISFLFTHAQKRSPFSPYFLFYHIYPNLRWEFYLIIWKMGRRHMVLDVLVITHKIMPHKTLFFFFWNMIPKNHPTL